MRTASTMMSGGSLVRPSSTVWIGIFFCAYALAMGSGDFSELSAPSDSNTTLAGGLAADWVSSASNASAVAVTEPVAVAASGAGSATRLLLKPNT